jgi:hypothetical protein
MEESRWIGKVPRTPRTSITEIEGKLRAGAGSGKSDKDREEWLREYLSGVDRAMRAEQERSELVGALYMQDWQWTIEKNDRQLKAEQEYFKTLEDIKLAQAEGEAAAREENLAKMKKEQDEMVRFTQRTAEAMQNNFSSLFLDIMQGKLEGFKSFAVRIFQSIQEAAADYLGQIATEFLFGTLMKTGGGGGGGLFGSLLGLFGGGAAAGGGMASAAATSAMFAMMLHEGGTVGSDGIAKLMPAGYFAGAPRLHGGLAADEYPAILQRGEKVIPAQGNASGEAGGRSIIVNINAIDSASLAETMARNPSAIISPFLTALNQGGQVRNALKNVM